MSSRPDLRRFALLAATIALLGTALAVPISAANTSVTGSLSYRERIALTPNAVAIVTIVDQTAAADAGAVVGQQRIDAPAAIPIDFSVLVDADTIDPTHSYALFATIVDGTTTWQNATGEPVITGGPTKGVDIVLTALPSPAAIVGGTILPPAGARVDDSAVAIAALIKVETGTLVARQVRPVPDPADLSFSIGFDPALLDPASTYVVKGGLVDGASVWQNREGVTAIEGGAAIGTVQLPVTLAPTGLPVASAAPPPTQTPTATPAATATPTATPTSGSSASATPTATPTATSTPTATPTATSTPTATPTPAPTASPPPTAAPTPTATPTAVPSGVPSPSPITGPVTGTLTYREPYALTGDAFAVVALVHGSARVTENSIVASEIDRDISSLPVSFSLDLGSAVIDPSATYTIQATIVDGDNAWVTAKGVPVLTKGNPSKVAITLDYRPDVLKGAVTGQITGVGIQPSATAFAMAVLVDPATGASLGIDVKTVDQGLPVAFSIPYSLTDIQPTADYVVTAEVGDSDATWRNAAGVPVITNGNPKTAVQVVVTEVSTPAPSATPVPTPAPSAAPAPESGGTGDVNLLAIIILIAMAGAIAAFLVARGRGTPDTPTPGSGTPSEADAAATDADIDPATPSDAAPSPDATAPEPAPPVDPPGPPADATRPT